MKTKAAFLLLILLLLMLCPVRVTSQWPPVSQELAGGRPGSFRFSTAAQLDADRADLAELRASLERVQSLVPSVANPATRQALQAELEKWQLHAAHCEQRLTSSAGHTAATVESRLNDIKGRRQCNVCHGAVDEPSQ